MHSLVRDYGVQPDDLNSMFGYFEKTNKMALRDIYDPKGSQERILACDGVKTINLQDIFINIEVGK